MKLIFKALVLLCCMAPYLAGAQQNETSDTPMVIDTTNSGSCCVAGSCCNGTQTPMGVTTDHVHPKGVWMISYYFMNMAMKGNRTGISKTSDKELYTSGYMMAPATMAMKMHMLMVMYGVTDRLTLMLMGGYTSYNMGMNMEYAMVMPGSPNPTTTMTSVSSGLSDTKLSALYNFSKKEDLRIVGSMGIGLPTGSIKLKGTTMLGTDERLPYDMQTGTGSISISPDVTCVKQSGKLAYGCNAGADIKLNKNELKYKQGNIYHGTAWVSHKLFSFVSGSVRAEWVALDKITGADSVMAQPAYEQFDPSTSTKHYGGTWGNIYGGLNFNMLNTKLRGLQILLEFGMPVYENLNGPQMSVSSYLMAGVQYRF